MKEEVIRKILGGNISKKVLVTTDGWFMAPDGQQYKAVFGQLGGIFTDKETMGVETNNKSTNWYALVGGMIIAGCQIHYAILTDECDYDAPCMREELIDGKLAYFQSSPRIWHAK